MKDPEQMRVGLQEGIFRTIDKETDGALDHDTAIWFKAEALIESIIDELFGEEKEEDEMEELCADMDQFAEE